MPLLDECLDDSRNQTVGHIQNSLQSQYQHEAPASESLSRHSLACASCWYVKLLKTDSGNARSVRNQIVPGSIGKQSNRHVSQTPGTGRFRAKVRRAVQSERLPGFQNTDVAQNA